MFRHKRKNSQYELHIPIVKSLVSVASKKKEMYDKLGK